MAKNTGNNRISVKWVRDKCKSAYDKKDTCEICGTTEDLELHHTHSITLLLNKWAKDNNYDISTDEGILAVRDEFIASHRKEIYDDVYTLCNRHHVALHSVYGKAPPITSAGRQSIWIQTQKARFVGGAVDKVTDIITDSSDLCNAFSSFYVGYSTDLSQFYRKNKNGVV